MARISPLHELESRERRARWFPALAGLLSIALIASTWVGLFGFMGATAAYGTFNDLKAQYVPDVKDMALDLPDLSRVSRVYAATGEMLAELNDGKVSDPVQLSEVPDVVIHAALAAEDKDYYEHGGVSFPAIFRAALQDVGGSNRQGGSTITQQVVKQNFVGDERTIQRKITEAFVAAELERRYSKDLILEYYLNSVYFGSGAYGIKAAAREYFGKDLDQLTIEEAATLPVMVRNPSFYDPRKQPEFVIDRRNRIIDTMAEKGWITTAQATAAKRKPLEVIPHHPFRGEADHVVAEVKRELLNDPQFAFLGVTKEERKRAIFGCPADDTTCTGGGGLRIYTTLDLGLQKDANKVLTEWLPLPPYDQNLALCKKLFPTTPADELSTYAESHSCAPTGAIAMVDNATGAVKVMASGLPFDFSQFDLAVQGSRNPGSAFKPFGLVTALENGIPLGSYWDGTSPKEIDCGYPCAPNGGTVWKVSNAGSSYGMITLNHATSSSVNVVYAQVAVAVGPQKIADTAHRMGIQSPLTPVPSIVLGTSSVSPLEMASAFSNFATNGMWAKPYLVSKIVDASGKVIYEHRVDAHQVDTPAVFAAARRPLTRVPTGAGTAPAANIGRAQGGKTGTHQDYRDAWFVGFVPQYTAAVWVGYERDQLSLRNVTIHGKRYARVYGGSVPGPIWAQFMRTALKDVPKAQFPKDPPGVSQYLVTPNTAVPLLVGLTQDDAVKALNDAHLANAVVQIASPEAAGTVVEQDVNPGTTIKEGVTVTIKVANGQTPSGDLPNLAGMTYDDALNAIRDLENQTGLKLNVLRKDVNAPDPSQKGLVLSTNPPANSPLQFGDRITLYVGK